MKKIDPGNRLPDNELGKTFLEKYKIAISEVHKEVLELDGVIEQVYIAMFADGHIILDGEPGVGKTLVVNTIARTVNAQRGRIQFSPETLPSDLYYTIGSFDEKGEGKTLKEVRLAPGPLFTQILIGDEINRANPRIHAALLEPLEEKQITLEGKTTSLGNFYFFASTQNPVESAESTSELPEALRERLLLMIHVPYPSEELLRKIAVHDTRKKDIIPVLSVEDIVKIQNSILEQYVLNCSKDDPVIRYIQRLISAIHENYAVKWGPGIRAAQDLTRASAVHAFLYGLEHISFEDVQAMIHPALRFKFLRDARKSRELGIRSNDEILSQVLKQVLIVAEGS